MLAKLDSSLKQYLIVTGNYWLFTLTDGALRMLVVLYFHQLGYGALDIALLFIFYEFFGVVTNLIGGWLGAQIGLNRTMQIGLGLQVFALVMLTVPESMLTIVWVMAAQALSGIAKDLNKMSAKSSIKGLIPAGENTKLYKWVAILTGSKNTLKGVGFFLGALLLSVFGFSQSMWILASVLGVVTLLSGIYLNENLGVASRKPKFKEVWSKSRALNLLSLARMLLFSARDIWFVVALPVFLSSKLLWSPWTVGAFMACWVIIYGIVQAMAPVITKRNSSQSSSVFRWGGILTTVTLLLALVFGLQPNDSSYFDVILIIGLLAFGFTFAINSSLHSFLIIAMAKSDGVSLDVGFYYMANALGRLLGTVLSGFLYQQYGLAVCLWGSAVLLLLATITVKYVPKVNHN
jgi:predicted MFS family arabinose efflux permease